MIDTYRIFAKYADREYLKKTNEELVKMYRNANNEYERSQSISCLYVKNIGMLMRISNKCSYLDSSEKAGMILEEMTRALNSYDSSTKFVTYLTTRISNLFLWNYGNNKREIEARSNMIYIDEDRDEDTLPFQVSDREEEDRIGSIEFFASVDNMFKAEISRYSSDSREDKSMREKLELARNVFELLKKDDSLVASQLSALLGMFKLDKSGNPVKVEGYTIPEYKSEFGEIRSGDNRATQWYKINKAKYLLRDLLLEFGIVNKKI